MSAFSTFLSNPNFLSYLNLLMSTLNDVSNVIGEYMLKGWVSQYHERRPTIADLTIFHNRF